MYNKLKLIFFFEKIGEFSKVNNSENGFLFYFLEIVNLKFFLVI